jgi:hypothetical protein
MSSPPILINVVIAALAGDRCPLLCPMCGSTQVQPVRVSCHPAGPAGGVVCVDAVGVHIDRTFHAEPDALAVLRLGCARGHAFSYVLRAHGGQTLIERHVHVGVPSEPGLGSLLALAGGGASK